MSKLTVAPASGASMALHAGTPTEDRPLRILCATDLRSASDRAIARALLIAERRDAKLLLLHVVDSQTPRRIAARRADHAHAALRWRLRDRKDRRSPAISVMLGEPRDVIASKAESWRADIIVLGAHTPRRWDAVLGTTAERLVSRTDQAVLVVRGKVRGQYSKAAIVAESDHAADRLTRRAKRLDLVSGAQASSTVVVEVSRTPWSWGGSADQRPIATLWGGWLGDVVEQIKAASANLIVVEAPRAPMLRRLMRSNLAGQLTRNLSADLLILNPQHPLLHMPRPWGDKRLAVSQEAVSG